MTTGRFILPTLAPLPLPDPANWRDNSAFQAAADSDLTTFENGVKALDTFVTQAGSENGHGQLANLRLADQIAAGATDLAALMKEQAADSVDAELSYVLNQEASALYWADKAVQLPVPPVFAFDLFDLVASPDSSGLLSLTLPGETPPPTGGGSSTPPFIFIPPAAGSSQVPAYLSQGLATVAGVVGTLIFVVDAFLVFNYLTSYNFAAALAAYDAVTKAWAATDPIGFAIWKDNQMVATLKAQQLTGVGGNATYLQIQQQIDRINASLAVLHKLQYYGGK